MPWRWHNKGIVAQVEGVRFQTYYFTAWQVRQAFPADFEQVELEGLSAVTPTADNDAFARRRPTIYNWLVKVDDWLSRRRPFNGWGDFFILSMRYQG